LINGGFVLPLCNHCPCSSDESLDALRRFDLERRVAVEALLTGEGDVGKDINNKRDKKDEQRQELLSLGIRSASSDELDAMPSTDHDENMEATRLILIQYRVVNGANDAAAVVLAPHP
jgi:hypothetical protein